MLGLLNRSLRILWIMCVIVELVSSFLLKHAGLFENDDAHRIEITPSGYKLTDHPMFVNSVATSYFFTQK